MADVIKLNVPGKPEYVAMVRLAVSSVAGNAGFDIEAIEDIKVAVSEACNNVVCHCNSYYEVSCLLNTDKLEIRVKDDGCGYEKANYKEPSKEYPKEGGLGIFIIRALMDEVDIKTQIGTGTSITMIKYYNK